MRPLPAVLIGSSLFMAGCSASSPEAAGKKEAPRPLIGDDSKLALTIGDTVIQVGDDLARAKSAIKAPDASKPIKLPTGLDAPYKALGWKSASEGAGIISYEERVAVVIKIRYGVTEDRLGSPRRWFERQEGLNPQKVDGATAHYEFVQRAREMAVLAEIKTGQGKYTVVQAVGVPEVLAFLRLDPKSAAADTTFVLP